jgi:4-hydroxybenzoate polyprenyltransferase
LILGAAAQGRALDERRDLWFVLLFGIGAIVMRGAGCAYNDIVDRKIDAAVARTRARPIPSGAVTVKQAAIFTAILCLIGLVILLQFNRTAIALGAGSLILIALYPFMKRITWWPQAWLGLTFNWGVILGFAAITGRVTTADLVLYAGCFFWTLGYDTIYALQDIEDDALAGVKSTARLFGVHAKRWVLGFHAAAWAVITTAGLAAHLGIWFLLLMLFAAAHLLWQVRMLRIDRPAVCLKLFRANRDTGALIAAALLIAGWLL